MTQAIIGIITGLMLGNYLSKRFTKQKKDGFVLDTSALLDSRLRKLDENSIIQQPYLIPSRVLAELETFASSKANKYVKQKKSAHLALEWLKQPSLFEYDDAYADEDADQQVVLQAIDHGYRVISLDKEVINECSKKNVESFNIDHLEQITKSDLAKGGIFKLKLRYKGHKGSAIAILPTGETVVVADASAKIGTTQEIEITKVTFVGKRRIIEAKLS